MRRVRCTVHSKYRQLDLQYYLLILLSINEIDRCGENVESLYVEFSEGNIRLTRCVSQMMGLYNFKIVEIFFAFLTTYQQI